MACRVLTWNLFHGRDRPPSATLRTLRSRLLRISERDATHSQVNRELFDEFAALLAGEEWDVALLQESPPRWAEPLAVACRAEPHLVLTSRNLPGPLRSLQWSAARLNPDLIASWEGGSNLTLVRGTAIAARRQLTLARIPEARRMAFTELRSGPCIANLHASEAAGSAAREVLTAARTAVAWASGRPLVFGGDLNLRPRRSPEVFESLATELDLVGAGAADAIDHLLVRGLERTVGPRPWPAAEREVRDRLDRRRRRLRLSDHAPVEVVLETPASGGRSAGARSPAEG